MKRKSRTNGRKNNSSRAWLLGHCVTGASLLVCGATATAAQTNALTAEQMFEGGKDTYNNWVELSFGGLLTHGNPAQAQQRLRLQRGAFGGIQDFHLQQTVATNTTLTVDGRALADQHDYKVSLDLKKEDVGFVRFNYENFRTWANGAGGYYSPTGFRYSLPQDDLALDRGEISFEAGLAMKKIPNITFKYSRRYRDGDKASTEWGVVHPGGSARGLAPSFYDIDEKVDTFSLDVTHKIKATDLGLGIRYETGDLNNALKTNPGQGEGAPAQQKVTDRQQTTYDLLSVHAFSETWLKKNLFFSSGFLFANLDNAFGGSRTYSQTDFDLGHVANPFFGLGYFNLNGGSHKQEYVLNLNLMSIPLQNFTIVPSIRALKEDLDGDSGGTGTLGNATGPFNLRSSRDSLEVRERLDLRYSGVTNWVFYGGGEWTQGEGDLEEVGGLSRINGIGPATVDRRTDDTRFCQKYSVGTRWYPARRVTVDVGGYYKNNRYDYESDRDSTANNSGNRYPDYLRVQGFETYDGNARLTLRPFKNVSLVSRYEYQLSTVNTTPDSISGLGKVESSYMTSHILGQNVSWTPWSRLSLQAGFNYVLSNTKTPPADFKQTVFDAQNDYWTLNFNSMLVLDDRTDLNFGYFYYRADNFADNSMASVLYGAAAEEHGVTATITRRLSERVRLNLKYGFYHYAGESSGWKDDYEAHVIYSSLQYRF